jgi:hypothetical protein
MEAFAVDVHFQGIVREVKLDASTKLDEAFVGVLHAKVIEQLPEGDARRAASLELQVSIGNDEFLAFGEVLKQLPDDARVLSSLAPEASEADTAVPKPFMKLVEVEASAEIMLVNGAGERKGVLCQAAGGDYRAPPAQGAGRTLPKQHGALECEAAVPGQEARSLARPQGAQARRDHPVRG